MFDLLAVMETGFGTPSDWKEFGLFGLVIGALFVLAGGGMTWALNFASRLTTQHKEERGEWKEGFEKVCGEHTCERREWYQQQAARDARLDETLGSLKEAIDRGRP